MPYENLVMGQGPAKLASDEDLERDEVGFTNPNLHRRIDSHAEEGEYLPREYKVGIYGTESYRLTESFLRDENDNTEDEIP